MSRFQCGNHQLKWFEGLLLGSQGHNLALTFLYVQYSLNGTWGVQVSWFWVSGILATLREFQKVRCASVKVSGHSLNSGSGVPFRRRSGVKPRLESGLDGLICIRSTATPYSLDCHSCKPLIKYCKSVRGVPFRRWWEAESPRL